MKALIVDDEAKARELVELMVRHHIPEITTVKKANGPAAASEILTSYTPDLVFLDIKMPGTNGFEWLKGLNKRTFDVIFITAYDQYAIRAIRFAAFDYLLKPVDPEDLREAMDRYLELKSKDGQHFDNLFHNAGQADPMDFRLTISTTEGTHYLAPSEIVHCEADGNYTFFHMEDGRRIISSRSLGQYADLLGDLGFIRCHKSHLVNRRFVSTLGTKYLELRDGSQIEVSRRRMSSVKEAMAG